MLKPANQRLKESLELLKQFMLREGWDWGKYASGDFGELLEKAGIDPVFAGQSETHDYTLVGVVSITPDEANKVLDYRGQEVEDWITTKWSSIMATISDPNVTEKILASSLIGTGVMAVGKKIYNNLKKVMQDMTIETAEEAELAVYSALCDVGIAGAVGVIAALTGIALGVLGSLAASSGSYAGAFLNITPQEADLSADPFMQHGALLALTGDPGNPDNIVPAAVPDKVGGYLSIPVAFVYAEKHSHIYDGGLYGVGGGFSVTFPGMDLEIIGMPAYLAYQFEVPFEAGDHDNARAGLCFTNVIINEDTFKNANKNLDNDDFFLQYPPPSKNINVQLCKFLHNDDNAYYTIGAVVDTDIYPSYSIDC